MKLVVIADIHGNLEAFSRVLDEINKILPDRVISLGDNIGYGPDPEKVMELIKTHRIVSVLGNHELAVLDKRFLRWFNPIAQKAVLYTIGHLSEKSVAEIQRYKKSLVFNNMRFVHGTPPSSVAVYLFQISDKKLIARLDKIDETVCFAGHTHDLGLIEYNGRALKRLPLGEGMTRLRKNRKYIINAGSVGQPRDSDNRAKYLIFDTDAHELEVRFVSYDFRTTVKKIEAAGIPETYARKLEPF